MLISRIAPALRGIFDRRGAQSFPLFPPDESLLVCGARRITPVAAVNVDNVVNDVSVSRPLCAGKHLVKLHRHEESWHSILSQIPGNLEALRRHPSLGQYTDFPWGGVALGKP